MLSREFMGYSAPGGFMLAGMFCYITSSPHVIMETYHASLDTYALIFGLNAVGLILSSQINARLIRVFGVKRLLKVLLVAPILISIGVLVYCYLHTPSIYVVCGYFFLFVAAVGSISPNAAALALSSQGKTAGTASSLIGVLQYLFATAASFAFNLNGKGSVFQAIFVMTLCAAIAWGSHALLTKRHGT